MRSALRLTQALGATIHIGQSSGSELLARTIQQDGWLGSTMAEVASHSDTIVYVGNSLYAELPRLHSLLGGETKTKRLLHIKSRTNRRSQEGTWLPASDIVECPSLQLYDELTELCESLVARRMPISDVAKQLHEFLAPAINSAWVWQVDEFTSELDLLIVKRLLTIARHLSAEKRCSLLAVDPNPGRVTAEETLRWTTGLSPTATWKAGRWQKEDFRTGYSLDDWRSEFDYILLVRGLISDREFPQLPVDALFTSQLVVPQPQAAGPIQLRRAAEIDLPILTRSVSEGPNKNPSLT
ncbi:MAG: hypothetical protein KDB03_27355, partial [Planctomycetales bacterium]|nr:hypothetical protein [Planctomycetales bacterium]